MDADVVRTGATVGLAVAMPLGPIGLVVVGLGRRDWRSGGAAAAGVAAADLTWAAVAVTGGAAIAALPGIAVWQAVARGLLIAVGGLLMVRGVRRLRSGGGDRRRSARAAPGARPVVRGAVRPHAAQPP